MLTPLIDYVNCLALMRCHSAIAVCNFSFFVFRYFPTTMFMVKYSCV